MLLLSLFNTLQQYNVLSTELWFCVFLSLTPGFFRCFSAVHVTHRFGFLWCIVFFFLFFLLFSFWVVSAQCCLRDCTVVFSNVYSELHVVLWIRIVILCWFLDIFIVHRLVYLYWNSVVIHDSYFVLLI